MKILGGTTVSLQKQPQLTEAMVRAFMFADASVADAVVAAAGQPLADRDLRCDDQPATGVAAVPFASVSTGQLKQPFSRRLAHTQRPLPSQ